MGRLTKGRGCTAGEYTALFAMGGAAYVCLELAWRGRSHWTMFAAGGCCLCLLRVLAGCKLALGRAAALGAGVVSAVELAAGLLCNRVLHLAVWDYSAEWGNVAGLICPKYSFLWYLLCAWVIFWLRRLGSGAAIGFRPPARLFKRELYRTP